MGRRFRLGDWVQAESEIGQTLPDGSYHVCAEPGGVGHVMEEVDSQSCMVWFERSGWTTICHVSEIKLLCDARGENPESDEVAPEGLK